MRFITFILILSLCVLITYYLFDYNFITVAHCKDITGVADIPSKNLFEKQEIPPHVHILPFTQVFPLDGEEFPRRVYNVSHDDHVHNLWTAITNFYTESLRNRANAAQQASNSLARAINNLRVTGNITGQR